ncbi:MAG: type 4a pilus biogenesis protein PilO [Vicinamibacterales bacterium]
MASFSLGKLQWQAQLGVFVALSLVGAGAFYYFYEMPRQAAMETQARELSNIRGRISKGQATARQLPEFRAQVADLEGRLDALKPILPDERDAGDLLRRVQTLAVQSNLVIRGFRPQPISVRELHAEWPISLQLEGNYHNLGLFLDRVSKFPRIINIGGLTLAQRESPSAASTMTITCTATTFVLVEQAAAPATTKKGKKGPAKKAPAKS